MKKVLLTIAATFVALATYAQGSFNFSTFDVDYKVKLPDGVAPAGNDASVMAQIFRVMGDGSLVGIIPARPFYGTDVPEAARFYVNPPDTAVVVPGTLPNDTVTLRFRAFNGADFGSATIKGESANFDLKLGGGVVVPPNLDPLAGGSLTLVPEPSTIVLGVLGAAALLFRRRK